MTDASSVEQLLYREARYLDQERYEEWLALYSDDCEYWVPAAPGQASPRGHVSLFYEDRVLMETRIRRLRHSRAHSLMPRMRTCRLLSNIALEGSGADTESVVTSSFHLLEYRREKQRLFGGHYTHRLRRDNGQLKISSKRVDLINCDAALEVMQTFL